MSAITRSQGSGKPARHKMGALSTHEAKWGLIFLSPWLVGFLIWFALPMLLSLWYSFTNFDMLHPADTKFIGLGNYEHFFQDPLVGQAIGVTLRFVAISVPVGIGVPLALAVLVNSRNLLARPVFRTLFYMPYIVPLISAVYIWRGFLGTNTGWLNLFLGQFGIPGPDWLNTTTWIYPALVMIGLWGIGNTMITMVAGLQGVPTELYEAARVDGAGTIRVFFNVTLPLITPVIFYNLILILIGTFQYFLVPWVIKGTTVGDPGGATWFYGMYIFKTYFIYDDVGYAATMAWILFFVALVITIVLFGTQRRWVYYAGEQQGS